MGALASVSPWTTEDDVLLRKAVEAGASLESLAKGAVQFSRKFTVRELQDRWHSLLYDPVVSAEASLCMVEFERSVSTLPSKFLKPGNTKENNGVSRKRKAEGVRGCYYALRRRIHNEPFNIMDLNLLVATNSSNSFGNVDEPFPGNYMLGDPISGHFKLEDSNFEVMHCARPPEEGFRMQQNNSLNIKEIPHVLEENGSGELPSTFGQTIGDPGNVCFEFEREEVFDLAIPECDAPFDNLDYSCSPPEMTMWRTAEGTSSTAVPVGLVDRERGAEDTSALPYVDGANNTSTSGYDVHTESKFKLQTPCEEMRSPHVNTENYLEDLSNSLLEFTNDEELLFIDDDGKDLIDETYYDGLSSLLLSSPNDVNQDHAPNIVEPETSLALEYRTNPTGPCPGEFDNNGKPHCKDGHEACNSEIQMVLSEPASNLEFPELSGGVICCTLNTEDPEIPWNDDVFIPSQLRPSSISSVPRRIVKEADDSNSKSAKNFAGHKKMSERGLVPMQSDSKNPGQPLPSCQMIGSKMGQILPIGNCGDKLEVPNIEPQHVPSKIEGLASGVDPTDAGTNTDLPAKLREETKGPMKQLSHNSTDYFNEKPDTYRENASGENQQIDLLSTDKNHLPLYAEIGSTDVTDSELIANPPTQELEELAVESDDDIPYFSDIEAMILDMDLDPDDQDIFMQEVSRYRCEDSLRVIMRLEQGAHSYMQRAIASHGAFAILYGRHSKHYIKKSEVVLGRATEGTTVDIDLGKEERANKISRRQAIIKMDKDGLFHLKNLGKRSISVNNNEAATGQSLSLSSCCLIEITGMPFVFETNQACVKRYLDSISPNQTGERLL
ncbi:FHA domain-containing protein/MCRS_N domain-containing protein [Cephalotus follicularis]|uniref:FHA domain-containing protein/MCRS_N domain-containing protein n=1 Tax=Cephalotus follicularis TaxID=3775 RepID=A0A1Q3BWT0_CEPFO|nr:FHA domain-containing protein/MCRS_N domain-containing protein [Cephalotus follicularis]